MGQTQCSEFGTMIPLFKLEAARSAYLWLTLVTFGYLSYTLLGCTTPYGTLLGLTGPYWALFCICALTN